MVLKTGITIAIILLFVGAGAYLFFGTNLVLGAPQSCNIDNNDYRCVCGIGQVKTGFFPWACEDLPDVPAEVTFPIETYEEAFAYAESLMGGFDCSGDFRFEGSLTGAIPKQCNQFGNVGVSALNSYKGHRVGLECKSIDQVSESGSPVLGHIIWDVEFDPNDGWVYRLMCNPERTTFCPEETFASNSKFEPEPICGDGCCHNGEDGDSCTSDCENEIIITCEAEEVTNWIATSGGQSAYETLCNNLGGDVITLQNSPIYENCNYGKFTCTSDDPTIGVYGLDLGGGIAKNEFLKWTINYQGDCEAHRLIGYSPEVICPLI